MDCKTFDRHVNLWLAGKVDGRTLASLRAHEAICADCRDLHQARQTLYAIVFTANRDERPTPLVTDLLQWAKARQRG